MSTLTGLRVSVRGAASVVVAAAVTVIAVVVLRLHAAAPGLAPDVAAVLPPHSVSDVPGAVSGRAAATRRLPIAAAPAVLSVL